ncbi:putative membrane protein [Rhodococcus sp. AW25M09]|uniref:cutinase family protein n=1 Tax=Rhodococcus sp. AW25M09 TaxID=1268303 RepID=UPI0002AC4513|nr:cutinase family protein [Rhodococcus sp. AW25M09]CCQ18406.1 putative membrane protein [Rhodococcus sp. AW25M09]
MSDRTRFRSIAAMMAVAACTLSVTAAHLLVTPPTASASPEQPWLDELVTDCPALYTLAVQGTGQSSPDAPIKADTGMLGTVLGPALEAARVIGSSLDRAYVPYPAAFGGAVPGGKQPYTVSVEEAAANLEAAAEKVVSSCPATRLAIIGYSQGAHAASNVLEAIGAGTSAIPAEKVAVGALFGSPTRAPGSPVFPGSSSDDPSPAPGSSGSHVSDLPPVSAPAPAGSGIGPTSDVVSSYGSLSGRVASMCQTGDLACDAPANAPIARAVTNVAGQAEVGGDPFRAVSSIGMALASTSFGVAVDVINEDVSVPKNSLENLSIAPKKSLSQRFAEASDPKATPPTGQEAIAALTKVGLVAVNAVVSVAKKVITPQTIAEVSAAGLSNPAAAFAVIAAKTAKAVIELVPPATSKRVVQQAFNVVKNELTANKDLFDLAALTSYANTIAAHTGYGTAAATPQGESTTQFVADWLAAAAADFGDSSSDTASSTTSSPSSATTTRIATPTTSTGTTSVLPSTRPSTTPGSVTSLPSASPVQ